MSNSEIIELEMAILGLVKEFEKDHPAWAIWGFIGPVQNQDRVAIHAIKRDSLYGN